MLWSSYYVDVRTPLPFSVVCNSETRRSTMVNISWNMCQHLGIEGQLFYSRKVVGHLCSVDLLLVANVFKTVFCLWLLSRSSVHPYMIYMPLLWVIYIVFHQVITYFWNLTNVNKLTYTYVTSFSISIITTPLFEYIILPILLHIMHSNR